MNNKMKNINIILLFTISSLMSCHTDDNQIVKEVVIGNQIWMAENLNVDNFRNRDFIYEAGTLGEWKQAIIDKKPAWCYYVDQDNFLKGKLYNWYAVNDSRILAPNGWHIPGIEEFNVLIDTLGGDQIAGIKLKSKVGWEGKGNGTDESGFSALPGGFRHIDGDFNDGGSWAGTWWTSTEVDSSYATYINLNYQSDGVIIGQFDKGSGFSVRCIKN
jgi:uncharacterized protein (TIGR02145 family)